MITQATRRIEFRKTPKRFRRDMFRYVRYVTTDGRYCVQKSKYDGKAYLPTVWYALRRDCVTGNWNELLGRHRTRAAAERTIQQAAGSRQRAVGSRQF